MVVTQTLLFGTLAFARAAIGVEGLSVPVYDIASDCTDPRLPALAGPWIVECARGGQVTGAVHIPSGDRVTLPRPLPRPGLADSALYGPSRDGGLFLLRRDGVHEVAGAVAIHGTLSAPAATDGEHIAVLVDGHIQAFPATKRTRRKWPTTARGWYPPALSWPVVAWVTEQDGDEDVQWIDLAGDLGPQVLSGGPGHQRHVVGSATHLAWVEDQALVIWSAQTHERTIIPTETGFSAPPTLWEGTACWEERTANNGIDLRCSDGMAVRAPGHQQHPSRYGPWLLYREGDRLMLYTAPSQ